jgi:hypothetical protein
MSHLAVVTLGGLGPAVMEDQITNVRDPRERVGEDEDGISAVEESVVQEESGSCEAEPPERDWNDHSFLTLRGGPLEDEAQEEGNVAQPPHDFPSIPLNS